MRLEAAGLLGLALAGVAAEAQAASAARGVDAVWLARRLELAGVSVALQAGAADPLAATTEIQGRDGPFAWRILFYECRDPVNALGCGDYEYVAAAVLSPGDQARADAWTRRQRIARAEVANGALFLRYTVSVAGGVSDDFPAHQHERWLDAADDLARVLDTPQASARGAATRFIAPGGIAPRTPGAVILSPPAPPAGPSLSAAEVRPAPAPPPVQEPPAVDAAPQPAPAATDPPPPSV